MKQILILLLSVVFAGFAYCQKDADVRVNLRDGSTINGKMKTMNVEITSDYGKLIIPFADITQVTLGIVPDRKNKTKIEFQLKQLQNENETTRQNAYDELLKIGSGEIYVIEEYMSTEAYVPLEEGTYTADELLSELKMKLGVNDLIPQDVVSFGSGYSAGGSSNLQTVSLMTDFGTLTIPRDKILSLDILYVPTEGQNNTKTFILQASKHISGNTAGGWVNTGITVRKGQKITITAKGSVTLASLSNAKYTPDGPEGTAANQYNYEGAYPQYGMVVYKIGDQGTATPAGSKFNGTAKLGGTVYLSIYETVYNASNTGSYNVSLKVY